MLKDRPEDFPKSDRIGEGLRPLLGNSVFLTNGETWKRQRRIIDPAFEGGRLKDTFPAMLAAAEAAAARLEGAARRARRDRGRDQPRRRRRDLPHPLLDSRSSTQVAAAVFEGFRDYQRAQPILNLAAFLPLPRWVPRLHRRAHPGECARGSAP